MMRVWCCGRVVNGVAPEFLEDLVRPAAEQHRVDKRDAVHGRLGLLVIGDDPIQVAIGSGKIPVCRHPVEHHDPSRKSHKCPLLAAH